MIQWSEQPPDFQFRPVAELFAQLSFATSIAVARRTLAPDVLFRVDVKAQIYDHLRQRNIEMGGLLLGRVFDRSPSPAVVLIESAVASEVFDGTGVSLRMGTGVWEKARLSTLPGQSVVGWYHSHPNLGAFFSGTDRRTQASFFAQSHSLGLVVDPVRVEERWFRGPLSEDVAANRVLELIL